ncbi:MAG: DUF1667 domain-containing protein [Lachnospiraceae bacterium]|nr:DUF1667 domain-containing protein [Lachnospiraceae bacterium]
MTRELTCIICPRGCALKIELEDGKILSVSGNSCPRGEQYAKDECCNPQRTVTSTVRCEAGRMVSVKTDRPIPKDKMFDCMERINAATAKLPVHIGDVILEDVFGSRVVATGNAE